MRQDFTNSKRTATRRLTAAVVGAAMALGPAALDTARAQPSGAPSGQITFTLTDPASSGGGVLGHGTVSFQGKDYTITVTGMRLARTSADAPKALVGSVYGLTSTSDIDGDYVSVPATTNTYDLKNAKGVRVALSPVAGGSHLPPHDAAHPVTIHLEASGQ